MLGICQHYYKLPLPSRHMTIIHPNMIVILHCVEIPAMPSIITNFSVCRKTMACRIRAEQELASFDRMLAGPPKLVSVILLATRCGDGVGSFKYSNVLI